MVGHGGSSAGSYLADPTSPIPSHCASIVVTSTLRVNNVSVHFTSWGSIPHILIYHIPHNPEPSCHQCNHHDQYWSSSESRTNSIEAKWMLFAYRSLAFAGLADSINHIAADDSVFLVLVMYCTFMWHIYYEQYNLTLTVLVATIDAQWEGMGDVGSVRYEPALLPPCPTIRVLSYSN